MVEPGERAASEDPAEPQDGAGLAATSSPADEGAGDRYRHLPERVHLEDTIATKEVDPAPDPNGGRDPERDFMLRYGIG